MKSNRDEFEEWARKKGLELDPVFFLSKPPKFAGYQSTTTNREYFRWMKKKERNEE